MREILFRGFYEDKKGEEKAFYGGAWHRGKWVYGTPQTNARGQTFICADMMLGWDVAPLTIGQFTGLTDKNGKKIFEGDKVKRTLKYNSQTCYGKVIFRKGAFCCDFGNLIFEDFDSSERIYEVIGTIHDHLLEANNE